MQPKLIKISFNSGFVISPTFLKGTVLWNLLKKSLQLNIDPQEHFDEITYYEG